MTLDDTKAERLEKAEQLILASLNGISKAEIARRIGVSRATAGRYVNELKAIEDPVTGKIFFDKSTYLNNVRLDLHEVMALYLSSALMTKTMDRKNRYAASVLRKLGNTVENVAPVFSRRILDEADILDGPELTEDVAFSDILGTLTDAWAEGRKVSLLYAGQHREDPSSYVFSPYVVLPNPVGRTFHTAGVCDGEDFIRVFRIDRIKMCALLDDTVSIPADFNAEKHFRNAWGIWVEDESTVKEVVIRFSSDVAFRVLETKWHQNEETQKQADGSVLWKCVIGNPNEMLPWIRGWGRSAEVIAPEDLRNAIAEEAEEMAGLYRR